MVGLMGDPQSAYAVIHLTGTNGKGSTARMLTALLVEMGLSVGTYTSPHLERINERMAWNGDPIDDAALAEVIEAVSRLEPLLDSPPTHFEILTAAAYRWFADVAVDVAVVEVGLGGRWDATNVADGRVAAITNVSLDHAEVIGPTLADIAEEKAGIIKAGQRGRGRRDRPRAGRHLHPGRRRRRRGGRVAAGPGLRLRPQRPGPRRAPPRAGHARRPLPRPVPAGARVVPGRERGHGAGRRPRPSSAPPSTPTWWPTPWPRCGCRAGWRSSAATRCSCSTGPTTRPERPGRPPPIEEAFAGRGGRILVVGMLAGRDPVEMLRAFDAGSARLVVACPPPSPRALPAAEVAAAARALGTEAEEATSVPEAVATALALAGTDEMVVVTGSLYVVGAARAALTGSGT